MSNNRIVPFTHFTGKQAYAIQDGNTKLFFAWCYASEQFANEMASRIVINSAMDQQVNWRARPNMLTLSERTAFDRRGD